MKLVGIALGIGLLCVCEAARPPQPLHGDLNFVYDPNSHYFSAITVSKCYITPLSHVEREHVLSKIGLQDIELKMMREWVGVLNETIVYHTDPNLPEYFRNRCKGQDIFLIQRNLPPEATFPSILG